MSYINCLQYVGWQILEVMQFVLEFIHCPLELSIVRAFHKVLDD